MDWRGPLAVAGGLLTLWGLLLLVLWLLRPRGTRLQTLIRVVPELLVLARRLAGDRSTPPAVRLAVMGLIVWVASPIDLVPEFLPVIGPLDDLVVAVIVLRYVHRRLGDVELRRRWPGNEESYELLSRFWERR